MYVSNFTQFYSTKSERERNLRREYEAQVVYRKSLQAFIDRWRYNANRAAQAQSKIKILEKVGLRFPLFYIYHSTVQLPELTPPVAEETESFRCVSLLAINTYEFLIFVTIEVPGDGEALSSPAPAFGGDIWIRFLKNHFESRQF